MRNSCSLAIVKQLWIFLIPLLLLVAIAPVAIDASPDQNEKPVVMVDNGHGQFINSSLLTKAITVLEEDYEVITTESGVEITENLLTGVDCLIIPNPGGDRRFNQQEIYALGQWLEEGEKGLMLLSNPYSENGSLTGRSWALNTILESSGTGTPNQGFYLAQGTVQPVKIAKFGSSSDNTMLTISDLNATLLSSNESESLTIETQATAVKQTAGTIVVADTGYDGFVVTPSGGYALQDSSPVIVGGYDSTTGSRVVMGGSTTMFSDLPHPVTGNAWVDTADNAEFLKHLVAWSLDVNLAGGDVQTTSTDWNWLMMGTVGLGAIIVIVGIVMHQTGRQVQLLELDKALLGDTSARTSDGGGDEGQEQLTRSQKRLRQRRQQK